MKGEEAVGGREGDDEEMRDPAYEKRAYQCIFRNPDGTLSGYRADDYLGAREIAQRIREGQTVGEEGVAALFLFRHYLELTLKEIVFDLRRIESRRKNVPRTQCPQQAFGHKLSPLWIEVKNLYPLKMGLKNWDAFDTDFVDRCICEFDRIDPSSERFRYPIEKNGPPRDRLERLAVAWSWLPHTIGHVHDVLETMDMYLVETFAQNEEWEAEMNSW